MTLHRFFVASDVIAADRFPLPLSIERQVRTVLRLGAGDRLVLLPGDGSEAVCRLDGGECVVEERRASPGEPRHRLTVVQALLKGDGLDTVVRTATEIGAIAIRLVISERCILRDLQPRRLERLRTIARESAEQSERGRVPEVASAIPLAEALLQLPAGSALLYEREGGRRLADLEPPPAVVIGPEGGFSPSEVDAARGAGLSIAGLGPRILRAHTVAAAASAVILSRAGDFA